MASVPDNESGSFSWSLAIPGLILVCAAWAAAAIDGSRHGWIGNHYAIVALCLTVAFIGFAVRLVRLLKRFALFLFVFSGLSWLCNRLEHPAPRDWSGLAVLLVLPLSGYALAHLCLYLRRQRST
jgi:hypothetical protein